MTIDAGRPAASGGPFQRVTPADLPDGAQALDLRIFPTRQPYKFGFSPRLWRFLDEQAPRYDLITIHSLNLFPQLAAYRAARKHDVPYIVTPHGALDPWLRSQRRARKVINDALWQSGMLRNASALQFTAQGESDLTSDIAPEVPRWIVPNGVDLQRFARLPPREAFRRRALGGHDGTVVLVHGRIAAKKGIDLLIEAFAAAAGDDAILVVVGPDDEGLTATLQALAARMGVGARVRFMGPLYGDDLLEALAAADVWALTSHTENFGNAVLEATAAGLPVLVSTEVNISDRIAEDGAGLVTTLDPADIERQLGRLCRDEALRRTLGERARAFAAGYDWTNVAPRLLEMYRAVARRPS